MKQIGSSYLGGNSASMMMYGTRRLNIAGHVDVHIWPEELGHQLEQLLITSRTLRTVFVGIESTIELGQVPRVAWVAAEVGPQACSHVPLLVGNEMHRQACEVP